MEVDVVDDTPASDNLSPTELLRNDMLNHLCKNTDAHFKSQQRGEPELLVSEKKVIAESILDRGCGIFLSRFGDYLLEDHFDYFSDCSESERYEVDFYSKRIRAASNKFISKVKIRNRRFEALKQLVNEGSYFSEYEMKKRNPLLYEQLIGKFLTEEEEKERTGVDTTNITFVNLLLEQYDRDQMKKLKEKQKEDEYNQREKYDDCESADGEKMHIESSNHNPGSDDDNDIDEVPVIKTLWGESMTDKSRLNDMPSSSNENPSPSRIHNEFANKYNNEEENIEEEEEEDSMSDDEKNLLMEEFRSSMFNSFLEGKDSDFDYNEVDRNSDYDDIDMRDLDEQDKYFNSETPEDVCSNDNSNQGNCNNSPTTVASDVNLNETDLSVADSGVEISVNSDELDKYVETLKDIENTEKITKNMEHLHH